MLFVVLGVLALALKLLGIGPVATWEWWWVLAPFGVAIVWWRLSDVLGVTGRTHHEHHEKQRQARRQATIDSMRRPEQRRR